MADARHPLCRLTRGPHGAHAVYRALDQGEATRRHRAHVTFHGPREASAELARELRQMRPDGVVELLYDGADQASLMLDMPIEGNGMGGLAVIGPALQQHRMHAVLDPVVAMQGRLHVRLVVPRHAEAQETLRALQDVQRAAGFADFRIGRIGPISPGAHVEGARRALASDQEGLLALAASMGYYQTPKAVTLEQIARTVGLSISPVHKRLKAAEEAIVTAHVTDQGAPELVRRRARRATHVQPTSPWEMQLRVRGDMGPASALAHIPDARASLHVLSSDGARSQASLLVVMAPEEAQTKFLSGLEDRAEISSVSLIERSPHHVACRLTTRERGPYSLGWWNDAWGYDAALRSILFEGGEAHVRALLTRPFTTERLDERLRDCARVAGWTSWEIECLRDLTAVSSPPTWPEPLTQRQSEVLRVAHALGYYRTPRGCTLEHVASTLGVSANAVHKNLVLAESKLIGAYLAAGL